LSLSFQLIIVNEFFSDGPFISCDSLYDFILSKLNDPSLPDGFSFGFMQLLQNLLTVNFYTASLRGTHWKRKKDDKRKDLSCLKINNFSFRHTFNPDQFVQEFECAKDNDPGNS